MARTPTRADTAVELLRRELAERDRQLAERDRELGEAREQQTATAEVLKVISRSPSDLQRALDTLAANASRLCGGSIAVFYRLDAGQLTPVAVALGSDEPRTPGEPVPQPVPLSRGSLSGRAVLDRRSVHVEDMMAQPDSEYPFAKPSAQRRGNRTMLAVPLLREGAALGAFVMRRRVVRPFTPREIALVETFADQAVIAIENARLFAELQDGNRALTDALAQQTATSEVLRVIASSPTDLQRVLDTIAASAARLCEATDAVIFRLEGPEAHAVARYGPQQGRKRRGAGPRLDVRMRNPGLLPIAVLRERRTIHFPDTLTVPEWADAEWTAADWVAGNGIRSRLGTPLLREGVAIGSLVVDRAEPRPFSEAQTRLLETFADQAVIAVENTRLFTELQERTRDLGRSVDELTALGEVTQAVSSTLDLETVLARIVDHARRLSGSDGGAVFEYDEAADAFDLRAAHGLDEALVAMLRERRLRMGEGVTGRAAAARAPVQVPDVLEERAYEGPLREVIVRSGYRALLAVPLLREDGVLGGLVVNRRVPGSFPSAVVALLQTFATQSALAIHNARLYEELETKGRELEEASRHKSQFLANMSHELRTPLNAILGYTELIADGIYGPVPEKIGGVLERVQASGQHLLGLINAVLDLAKIEAGQLSLTLQAYSPREVVHAVVSATGSLAAAKGLTLRVEAPGDLPAGRGDEQRLSQVLLNLVGNAIKFTDAGEVCVRASVVGDHLLVAVVDTGPGIAPDQQARIFEEFQQADGSSTRSTGGTGLGLAIARRIVALHGGRMWVESTPGQGSTFKFTLPVRVESQAVLG